MSTSDYLGRDFVEKESATVRESYLVMVDRIDLIRLNFMTGALELASTITSQKNRLDLVSSVYAID